jgi:KUP system potassium uptake protein
MRTWQWGRKRIKTTFENVTKMTVGELIKLRRQAKEFLPKSIVIMTPEPITTLKDKVPVLEQIFWDRYGMLPRDLIFLTVNIRKVAIVRKERYNIIKLFEEKGKGSIIAVQVNFGFMEQPNVEKVLAGIFKRHDINIDDSPENWLVHVMYENILPRKKQRLWKKIKYQLFRFMAKNSETADRIYGLGNRVSLSVEIVPVRF